MVMSNAPVNVYWSVHTLIYTPKNSGNYVSYVRITWGKSVEEGEVRILSDTELIIACKT